MKSLLFQNIQRIFLLCALVFLTVQCNQPEPGISGESFLNPPVEYRPLAYWDWLNGYIDTARMVHELEEMKDKGMQGAFIWDVGAMIDPENIVPAGPAFLGDESLEYISLALKTAKQLGLNLGLITSSSWNAGGPWIEEADASMQLLSTSELVNGPSRQRIAIGTPRSNRGAAAAARRTRRDRVGGDAGKRRRPLPCGRTRLPRTRTATSIAAAARHGASSDKTVATKKPAPKGRRARAECVLRMYVHSSALGRCSAKHDDAHGAARTHARKSMQSLRGWGL